MPERHSSFAIAIDAAAFLPLLMTAYAAADIDAAADAAISSRC